MILETTETTMSRDRTCTPAPPSRRGRRRAPPSAARHVGRGRAVLGAPRRLRRRPAGRPSRGSCWPPRRSGQATGCWSWPADPVGLGLAAAPLVGPEGTVVVSDVVAEMTAIAATRAAAMGLHNVTAPLPRPRGDRRARRPYDAVLCREGLMFASDPARAAGRSPASCARAVGWPSRSGDRGRATRGSAWCSTPSARRWVCRCRRRACPDRSPWRTPARLNGLLVDAGLIDVTVRELPVPLLSPSFEDWWTRTSSLAGPLSAVLAGLPAGAKADLESRVRTAVAPYETADGLRFPGLTLLASARRAR